MIARKILRILLITISCLIGLVLIILFVTIAPLQRDLDKTSMLQQVTKEIDSLDSPAIGAGFSIGYSKVNITPSYKTSTAGYGKRMGRLYSTVHDSIFVRTMVISDGSKEVAIVSADLLIIPPEVTILLEKNLPEIGFNLDNTYLGAIHSHNSIGNWGKGAMTLMYGDYDEKIVEQIAENILQSISRAKSNMLPSTIKSGAIPIPHAVRNRLGDEKPVDSLLRTIEIVRNDSSKLLMLNFTAHATCLFSGDMELSRDYPGRLIDIMESRGYAFTMFMAGAVGSHTGKVKEQGWPCVDEMANLLSDTFTSQQKILKHETNNTLWMGRVTLPLPDPQAKVLKNWVIRSWVFNTAFGDYPEYLTALRLGDLIMLGTPCDYSGEFYHSIDSVARANGVNAIVTSFNGGYIGYVTPTRYFDEDHYETQLMNWYGPGNSEYMEKCIEELLVHASKN